MDIELISTQGIKPCVHLLSDDGQHFQFYSVELVETGPGSGCGEALKKLQCNAFNRDI